MNPSIFHQNAWQSHNSSTPGLNLRLLVLSVDRYTCVSSGDAGPQTIGRKAEALPGQARYYTYFHTNFNTQLVIPHGLRTWLTDVVSNARVDTQSYGWGTLFNRLGMPLSTVAAGRSIPAARTWFFR